MSHDRWESGRGGSQIGKPFAPPSCRLDRPRGSYPGPGPVTRPLSSSSSSTLQPHPGFGWPLSRTPCSPPPTLGPSLTLTALPQALVPAARGPLQARVRGAWVSQDSDSGPLGQGPAARRALGAGRIPVLERALDLRGCTSGPQLPPLLPPSGAAPLPALTSPLSISPRPPPPGEGAPGSPGSAAPGPRASSWLPAPPARGPLPSPRPSGPAGRPGRDWEPRMV